jgi:hypothetical protein
MKMYVLFLGVVVSVLGLIPAHPQELTAAINSKQKIAVKGTKSKETMAKTSGDAIEREVEKRFKELGSEAFRDRRSASKRLLAIAKVDRFPTDKKSMEELEDKDDRQWLQYYPYFSFVMKHAERYATNDDPEVAARARDLRRDCQSFKEVALKTRNNRYGKKKKNRRPNNERW